MIRVECAAVGLLKFFSVASKKKGESAVFSLPLSEEGFREVTAFVDDREIRPRLPDLSGRKVIEIAPRQRPLGPLFREKGARLVSRVGGTKERESSTDPKADPFILSHWENLPFLDASWDFAVVRVSLLRAPLGRILREVSRVLAKKGGAILSDLHPFSATVQKDHLKNPVGEEGMGPGFERYLKIFREVGFEIEWVREIFFEGVMRRFFATEEQKRVFEEIRRTPLMILFSLRKG